MLAELNKGRAAAEIAEKKEASRKWNVKSRKVAKSAGKKVKKLLKKSNSTVDNSTRSMAAKLGVSHSTASRILKKENVRALKHVKTTHNAETKMAKRTRVAGEILERYGNGMKSSRIFWPDETQVDADTCARFNSQNERLYFSGGKKKDSVLDKLTKPRRQRAPGILIHLTADAAGGGIMLKPHFAKPNTTVTAATYVGLLRTDVFPQIAAVMPEGKQWYFQQDLASPHTAAATKQFLAERNVALAPWMPSGADCSLLDIFVNPELKRRPRGRDLSTQTKIMESCARARPRRYVGRPCLQGVPEEVLQGYKEAMQMGAGFWRPHLHVLAGRRVGQPGRREKDQQRAGAPPRSRQYEQQGERCGSWGDARRRVARTSPVRFEKGTRSTACAFLPAVVKCVRPYH